MNNVEKYQHTIDVLVKAYLNDTLEKANCSACAVGNLVADALGFSYEKPAKRFYRTYINEVSIAGDDNAGEWSAVFMTTSSGQDIDEKLYKSIPKEQIDATGYTWQELAKIEYAFETAMPGKSPESEFAGLMAVVEVLADIHQIDKQVAEQSKLLFAK